MPTKDILVFPISHSVDFSANSCRYSLCAVWICHWKQGRSYVSSRWISRYILPIPCDNYYSGSHCTHPSHVSGQLDCHWQCNTHKNRNSSIPIGTQPGLTIFNSIPHVIPPLPHYSICTSAPQSWIVASILNWALHTPHPHPRLVLLC